jgi:iron complex outermembrane receptor protein
LAAKTASFRPLARACAQALAAAALAAGPGIAQAQEPGLEEVIVTATRRAENTMNVPVSVTALEGERMEALFEGGEDIRALATRVPSLYAESSNGRLAPRFYIRGLGNTDFDLAASQPVSVIVDEVVLENVILKSSPLFDIQRVEVLRGPQGTLFGRNTPAGIVKFDTVKPSQDFDADLALSYGELDSTNVQGAIGGGLTDTVSARVSVLYQSRGDWIDNTAPGTDESDAMGSFDELAWRGQLLLEPTESFSALLNVHGRDIDGTASIFRANVLGPGSDGFNSNFDRDSVSYDWDGQVRNNPQSAEGIGGSLRLDYDFDGDTTLTSITAYENTESESLGDIDGGFGANFLGNAEPCPPGSGPGDPCIPFPATTQDSIDDLDQFTQEIRIASQASEQLFWQAGVYYFDSKFSVTTNTFIPTFDPTDDPATLFTPTTVTHENTAWAVFGHVSYDVSDALTISGGLRYTDDDKDMSSRNEPFGPGSVAPVSVSDDQVSGDISAMYRVSDAFHIYGRYARGFRAPTIQGRDIAFFLQPSVADSETIDSIEAGFKSFLADNRVRLNGSVYYYEISDPQFSAIGGASNANQVLNADKGKGAGFDLEGEFLLTDHLLLTAGFSYNDTEIEDSTLVVAACGSGMCTVTDPLDGNGNAIVDGNPFPQAPEYVATITARYGVPVGDAGEFFVYTDWAFQGDTNFFLYEAEEFHSGDTYEGGLRIGYSMNDGQYEIAAFGRNITDEENVKGAIDFNNLTGFDNEPRVIGVSFRANFD